MGFDFLILLLFYKYFLQLKKMSNLKPSAETSEPSETVEQGLMTNEIGIGMNTEELTGSTTKENGVIENGKNRKKRKFPSREEISKAR